MPNPISQPVSSHDLNPNSKPFAKSKIFSFLTILSLIVYFGILLAFIKFGGTPALSNFLEDFGSGVGNQNISSIILGAFIFFTVLFGSFGAYFQRQERKSKAAVDLSNLSLFLHQINLNSSEGDLSPEKVLELQTVLKKTEIRSTVYIISLIALFAIPIPFLLFAALTLLIYLIFKNTKQQQKLRSELKK